MNTCLELHPEAVIEHDGHCWCSRCGGFLGNPAAWPALLSAEELNNPNNPFVAKRNSAIQKALQEEKALNALRVAARKLPINLIPGYVYFALNAAMPQFLKVGFTSKRLQERMTELHTTGVPIPFEIGACYAVHSPAECEAELHQVLQPYRVSSQREFFQISLAEALIQTHPILIRYIVHSLATCSPPPTLSP